MKNSAAIKNQRAEELRPFQSEIAAWIKKHRPVLDIFLDAYCIVDLSNQVVDFNIAFNDLCGESYRKVLKIGNFCDLIKTEACPHQCPAKQVVTSQKPMRIDELTGSSKAFPKLTLILGGVPIFAESGEVVGSLITIRNVTAEDELQRKYLERKNDSIKDGLTGLYNKVFTEAALLRTVRTALRNQYTFSVVMLDIDHFKKINDTHGHQTGDFVLSKVAKIVEGEARGSDVVGRVGGEEFMAVLNNSNVSGTQIFAERLRKKIAETEFMYEGRVIPVTISIGTATFNDKWRKGLDAETSMKLMVTKADKALYSAKNGGRNRVVQFESLEE